MQQFELIDQKKKAQTKRKRKWKKKSKNDCNRRL